MAGLERIVRQKSDGRRTNQGRNDGSIIACNAATAMALQLAMLLLLRRCCSYNVAGATRCGAATTLLVLCIAAIALLLQRCWCYALRRCYCGTVAATLLL